MNNLQINLDVKLESGAKVALTEGQLREVTNTIKNLVFGEKKVALKAKKIRGPRKKQWSVNELNLLAKEVYDSRTSGKPKQWHLLRLEREIGRSQSAISTKWWYMEHGDKPEAKPEAKPTHGTVPVMAIN